MNLEEATKLKTELINKGFDTIIFDPQLSPHTDEIKVIVRGKDDTFVREKEKTQCERCFQYIPDKHGGFCRLGVSAPDEGENCPDFNEYESRASSILAAELKEALNELHVRRIMLKSLKESLMNYHLNKMNTYQIIREFNQVLIDGIITDHPELKNNKYAH